MSEGIEKRTRDGKEEIFFKVSAMPKEHFEEFKKFADKEWGGSYWHTIKFLLDWYKLTKENGVKFVGQEGIDSKN